jgi:hypothetical protein
MISPQGVLLTGGTASTRPRRVDLRTFLQIPRHVKKNMHHVFRVKKVNHVPKRVTNNRLLANQARFSHFIPTPGNYQQTTTV